MAARLGSHNERATPLLPACATNGAYFASSHQDAFICRLRDADGLEFCDHDNDPQEYHNLANDPQHAEVLKKLRAVLAEKLPPISK